MKKVFRHIINKFPVKTQKILLLSFGTLLLIVVTFLLLVTLSSDQQPGLTTEETTPSGFSSDPESLDERISAKAFDLVFSNPDSARTMARNALADTTLQISRNEEVFLVSIIGISYLFQSAYTLSLEYFYQSLNLAQEYELAPEMAHAYGNIGLAYLSFGNYKVALDYLLKANNNYILLNDTTNHSSAQNNIGSIYLSVNDLEKAIEHLTRARHGFSSQSHNIGLSSVLNHIGIYYRKQNMADSAEYYFNEAISLGKIDKNAFNLNGFYREKAKLFFDLGEYDKALTYYHKSDSTAATIKFMQGMASAKLGIARTYLEKEQVDSALFFVNQASEIGTSIQNSKVEYQSNQVLASIHRHDEDFEKALYYTEKAQTQKDSLMEITQLYQIYNIEIEQLTREKEIQQLKIQEQSVHLIRRKNAFVLTIIISGSLLIILSFLYYLYVNRIKQKQKNRLYEDKLQHSEALTKAVLHAEVQERKRIGVELHDGIGPMLSLTKMNVTKIMEDTTIDNRQKQDLLLKTIRYLDDTLNEMKYISQNLAPLVLLEKGFEAAIKDLISKIRYSKKFDISININGLNGTLETYVQHALYRTIQEVINNIIKHARASEINIEILQSRDDITVMVEDNGIGFDLHASKQKGFGLQSAVTRIEGLNGRFHIDSVKNRGTIVLIILPLPMSRVTIKTIKHELHKNPSR